METSYSFAALQVARGMLRERKLLELRSPTFLSRALSFPDTLELRKLLTFAGMLLGLNAILKVGNQNFVANFRLAIGVTGAIATVSWIEHVEIARRFGTFPAESTYSHT